jgi:hypothetical protein
MAKRKHQSRRDIDRRGRLHSNVAFTLVELLVVIAVIVLLASMLVPSLGTAREHQYEVTCKSNLHQLTPSLLMGLGNTDWKTGGRRDMELFDSLRCPKGSFENGGNQALNISGSIVDMGAAPPSVAFNQIESNTVIHGFVERTGYVLPTAVSVNLNKPGDYTSFGSNAGSISAGTVVDCYYLLYDPVGSTNSTSSGTISFSSPILGLIVSTASLRDSDPILGSKGTVYPSNQNARGFENGAERVELSEDMLTLDIIRFHSTFPGEHVRILTESGGVGSGSYGINGSLDPLRTRPGQILISEYGSSIIYPNARIRHEDTLDSLADEDRLHFGRLNVGFVDGSIRGVDPRELESDSPLWYYEGP